MGLEKDKPQSSSEDEEEEEAESSSSSSSAASLGASGSGRAPTPEKKAARSTVLEKDKDKEKEKDKEKGGGGGQNGRRWGRGRRSLSGGRGSRGSGGCEGEGKAEEGKHKGKEGKPRKEKGGGLGSVAFKIEGAAGPRKLVPVKTTRFKHYKENMQFMNDMQVSFTSHVLCFVCLQRCSQRRLPRYAGYPCSGSMLPEMLLVDICMFFASFRFWSLCRRTLA